MPDVKEVLEFAGEEVLQDAVDDLYLQLKQLSEALSKETRIALDYQKQRDELSDGIERCHRLLDAHYGENLETTSLDTLEDRLRALLAEVEGRPLESAG